MDHAEFEARLKKVESYIPALRDKIQKKETEARNYEGVNPNQAHLDKLTKKKVKPENIEKFETVLTKLNLKAVVKLKEEETQINDDVKQKTTSPSPNGLKISDKNYSHKSHNKRDDEATRRHSPKKNIPSSTITSSSPTHSTESKASVFKRLGDKPRQETDVSKSNSVTIEDYDLFEGKQQDDLNNLNNKDINELNKIRLKLMNVIEKGKDNNLNDKGTKTYKQETPSISMNSNPVKTLESERLALKYPRKKIENQKQGEKNQRTDLESFNAHASPINLLRSPDRNGSAIIPKANIDPRLSTYNPTPNGLFMRRGDNVARFSTINVDPRLKMTGSYNSEPYPNISADYRTMNQAVVPPSANFLPNPTPVRNVDPRLARRQQSMDSISVGSNSPIDISSPPNLGNSFPKHILTQSNAPIGAHPWPIKGDINTNTNNFHKNMNNNNNNIFDLTSDDDDDQYRYKAKPNNTMEKKLSDNFKTHSTNGTGKSYEANRTKNSGYDRYSNGYDKNKEKHNFYKKSHNDSKKSHRRDRDRSRDRFHKPKSYDIERKPSIYENIKYNASNEAKSNQSRFDSLYKKVNSKNDIIRPIDAPKFKIPKIKPNDDWIKDATKEETDKLKQDEIIMGAPKIKEIEATSRNINESKDMKKEFKEEGAKNTAVNESKTQPDTKIEKPENSKPDIHLELNSSEIKSNVDIIETSQTPKYQEPEENTSKNDATKVINVLNCLNIKPINNEIKSGNDRTDSLSKEITNKCDENREKEEEMNLNEEGNESTVEKKNEGKDNEDKVVIEEPKLKKKHKRLNELQKLNEDERQMFICQDVLNSNGRRVSHILAENKMNENASTSKPIGNNVDNNKLSPKKQTKTKPKKKKKLKLLYPKNPKKSVSNLTENNLAKLNATLVKNEIDNTEENDAASDKSDATVLYDYSTEKEQSIDGNERNSSSQSNDDYDDNNENTNSDVDEENEFLSETESTRSNSTTTGSVVKKRGPGRPPKTSPLKLKISTSKKKKKGVKLKRKRKGNWATGNFMKKPQKKNFLKNGTFIEKAVNQKEQSIDGNERNSSSQSNDDYDDNNENTNSDVDEENEFLSETESTRSNSTTTGSVVKKRGPGRPPKTSPLKLKISTSKKKKKGVKLKRKRKGNWATGNFMKKPQKKNFLKNGTFIEKAVNQKEQSIDGNERNSSSQSNDDYDDNNENTNSDVDEENEFLSETESTRSNSTTTGSVVKKRGPGRPPKTSPLKLKISTSKKKKKGVKLKRKRKGNWATGNFMKKPQKKNFLKNGTFIEKAVNQVQNIDKSYYTDSKKHLDCLLCSEYTGRWISHHYASKHPKSENFASRFPIVKAQTLKSKTAIPRSGKYIVESGKILFKCYFCDVESEWKELEWIKHITSHTGEYIYRCMNCDVVTSNKSSEHKNCPASLVKWNFIEFKSNILYGYMCSDCNFIQLQKTNVENHIKNNHTDHQAVKPEVIEIEMVNQRIKEGLENEPNNKFSDSKIDAFVQQENSDVSSSESDTESECSNNNETMIDNILVPIDKSSIADKLNERFKTPISSPKSNSLTEVTKIESPADLSPMKLTQSDAYDSEPLRSPGSPDSDRTVILKRDSDNDSSSGEDDFEDSVNVEWKNVETGNETEKNSDNLAIEVELSNKDNKVNLCSTLKRLQNSVNLDPVSSETAKATEKRKANDSNVDCDHEIDKKPRIDFTEISEDNQNTPEKIVKSEVLEETPKTVVKEEDIKKEIEPVLPENLIPPAPQISEFFRIDRIGCHKKGTEYALIYEYGCLFENCLYKTLDKEEFIDHLMLKHSEYWDGYCYACEAYIKTDENIPLHVEFKHLLDVHVKIVAPIEVDYEPPSRPLLSLRKLPGDLLSVPTTQKQPEIFLNTSDKSGLTVITPGILNCTIPSHLQITQISNHSTNATAAPTINQVTPVELTNPKESEVINTSSSTLLSLLNNSSRSSYNSETTLTVNPTITATAAITYPQNIVTTSTNNQIPVIQPNIRFVPIQSATALAPNLTISSVADGHGISTTVAPISAAITQHVASKTPLAKPISTYNEINAFIAPTEIIHRLKPWTKMDMFKTDKKCDEMLNDAKLFNLYKCMAMYCSYTTNDNNEFLKHLRDHEKYAEDQLTRNPIDLDTTSWLECPYCKIFADTCNDLVSHIDSEHSGSIYQCSNCFYRSKTATNVKIHFEFYHLNLSKHILVTAEPDNKFTNMPFVIRERNSNVRPLYCNIDGCTKYFFGMDVFVKHLLEHESNDYPCKHCSLTVSKFSALKHLHCHGFGLFECIYCLFGTNNFKLLKQHITDNHCSSYVFIAIRFIRECLNITMLQHVDSIYFVNLGDSIHYTFLKGLSSIIKSISESAKPKNLPSRIIDSTCLYSWRECRELVESKLSSLELNNSADDTTTPESSAMITNSTAITPVSLPALANLTVNNKNNYSLSNNADVIDTSTLRNSTIINKATTIVTTTPTPTIIPNLVSLNVINKNNYSLPIINMNITDTPALRSSVINHTDNYNTPIASTTPAVIPGLVISTVTNKDNCSLPILNTPTTRSSTITITPTTLAITSNPIINKDNYSLPIINVDVTDTPTIASSIIAKTPSPITQLVSLNSSVSNKNYHSLPILDVGEPDTSRIRNCTFQPNKDDHHKTISTISPANKNSPVNVSVTPTTSCSLVEEPAKIQKVIQAEGDRKEIQIDIDNAVDQLICEMDDKSSYSCLYNNCYTISRNLIQLNNHLLGHEGRASKRTECFVCEKNFKNISSLALHIKTHRFRFLCYFCVYKSFVAHLAFKHVAAAHKCEPTRMLSLNPDKINKNSDIFIIGSMETTAEDIYKFGLKHVENLKIEQNRNKKVFDPSEVELLPRVEIFTNDITCSVCNYSTKVRKNMERHLLLHRDEIPVPSIDPVNPVPCLNATEKHFDRMLNPACSSQADKSSLSDIPKFVKKIHRFVCGAKDCQYLTCNEDMLRCHINTLHLNETNYRCPHCAYEDKNVKLNLEKIIQHLRLHEDLLYKCSKCENYYNKRSIIDNHVRDVHQSQCDVIVIREETTATSTKSTDDDMWECKLCKYTVAKRKQMVDHCEEKHQTKYQYQCGICGDRSSKQEKVQAHCSSNCNFSNSYGALKLHHKEKHRHLQFVRRSTGLQMLPSARKELSIFYSCLYCTKRTTTVENIMQHWKEKHRMSKPYRPFQYRISKLASCYYCNTSIPYYDLYTHISKRHDKPFAVNNDVDARSCGDCDYIYSSDGDLIEHYKYTHLVQVGATKTFPDDLKKNQVISKFIDEKVPIFVCMYCKIESDSVEELENHHYLEHREYRESNIQLKSSTIYYGCNQLSKCNETSTDEMVMIKHIQKHILKHYRNTDFVQESYRFNGMKVFFPNGLVLTKGDLKHTKYGNYEEIIFKISQEGSSSVVKAAPRNRRANTLVEPKQSLKRKLSESTESYKKRRSSNENTNDLRLTIKKKYKSSITTKNRDEKFYSFYKKPKDDINLNEIYTTMIIGGNSVRITCARFANVVNINPILSVKMLPFTRYH